jgi:hypothetical protein
MGIRNAEDLSAQRQGSTRRCSRFLTSGPLHPSIKIGGCVSLGQCENECVPDLVFCYEHASREAMEMVIVSCKKEIEQLQRELRTRDRNYVGRTSPRRRKS